LLCSLKITAQNIVAAEYFFDTDPGTGNGTAITVPTPADSVNFNVALPTSGFGLTPGPHKVYVRTKDATGKWSLYEGQSFSIVTNLVTAEYFFDTDPGKGNGTPISVPTSDSINVSTTLPTAGFGLVPGPHRVYVRTNDATGKWSLYEGQSFSISISLVVAEYFFDTDPGPGNGAAISVPSPADSVNFNISLPTSGFGLAPGAHKVYLRTRDNSNKWSLYEGQSFVTRNTWIGSTTDAAVGSNWSSGSPDATTDVIIPATPSGGNMPMLTTGLAVHNIDMQGSSVVDLNGQAFTITGDITGTGTITGSSTSSIVINRTLTGAFGTLNLTNGSRSLNNLTINHTGAATPTVTLGNALDIYGTLTVTAGQLLLGNNTVTLKSTATGTARFASTTVATPFTYGTGKFIVERYISNIGRKWRLLSAKPALSTQTIFDSWQEGGGAVNNLGTWITIPGGGNGFDGSSRSSSILRHNQPTPSWVALTATNTGSINDYQGYMLFVRGDRNDWPSNGTNSATVLRITGRLNTGNQTGVTVSSTGVGRTLVGNPFASPVDMETLFTGTANLDQNMYVWDPALAGNYGVGGYRAVVRNINGTYDQTPVVAGGTVNADPTIQFIHSGQAIFLKASGANANVVFAETMKTVSPTTVMNPIVNTKGDQQIIANLMIPNTGNDPSLIDGIRVRYNDAYLSGTKDDMEKMGNFGENLSSYRDGKKLIVENRPMIKANDTIFLRITNPAIKEYQFQIAGFDFVQTGIQAWLQDGYTGKNSPINCYGNINTIDFSITTDTASANADRFRIVFTGNSQTPVIIGSDKPGLQVNPNPVTNHVIGLRFSEMPKGVYVIRLLNNKGQVILTQPITHEGFSATQNIQLGKGVIAGLYHLEIIQPDHTRTSRKIIVTD